MTDADIDLLLAKLDGQRAALLRAVQGLDENQAWASLTPSGWSAAGLLSHLTQDVEDFWFRAVIDADPAVIERLDGQEGWQPSADRTVAEIVAAYREAGACADEIVRRRGLAAAPGWWPEGFPGGRPDSVGDVVLHVLVETATHVGQLDVALENLDGRQRLVMS